MRNLNLKFSAARILTLLFRSRLKLRTGLTFVEHRSKDGQVVLDGGTVPSPAPELVLALLNPQLDAFRNAGHDFDVVATESQLLGHQAGDGAA